MDFLTRTVVKKVTSAAKKQLRELERAGIDAELGMKVGKATGTLAGALVKGVSDGFRSARSGDKPALSSEDNVEE